MAALGDLRELTRKQRLSIAAGHLQLLNGVGARELEPP
jgi:hypothetical protein